MMKNLKLKIFNLQYSIQKIFVKEVPRNILFKIRCLNLPWELILYLLLVYKMLYPQKSFKVWNNIIILQNKKSYL